MLFISEQGIVDAESVRIAIHSEIERDRMNKINGIVVHQTDSPTAESTFNSYKQRGANGAHFLIEKDGTIYQTASLFKKTNHVGLLKSRCVITKKCTPAEFKAAFSLSNKNMYRSLSKLEHKKTWPNRYPSNEDSIGIELVGRAFGHKGKEVYETVTERQNSALEWLIEKLIDNLNVPMHEIYKHPDISYKNITEASTAKW